MGEINSVTALWWAVIASGIYHGINPGMGWPLAVSAALMERKKSALAWALGALAFGHFLAMTAILLPFSMMASLVTWETEIRVGAGLLVIALGIYLLINRKHPKFLSRVPPSRLALWSFLAAMAHGAGLMLLPIYLGINAGSGHSATGMLITDNIGSAFVVAITHTAAMTIAGGLFATVIYFWLGLKFLSKAWFNLDIVWALSLILVGSIGIWAAL
ncbi:MAG: hypothetical protein L3J32_09040 [Rhizobiaceae bacterium]|nr:hypothetical protein [Rhizobiaceae bacterium]